MRAEQKIDAGISEGIVPTLGVHTERFERAIETQDEIVERCRVWIAIGGNRDWADAASSGTEGVGAEKLGPEQIRVRPRRRSNWL